MVGLRRPSFLQASPDLSAVGVVSVTVTDPIHATWEFDAPVAGISGNAGLLVDGNTPDDPGTIAGNRVVDVEYSTVILPGSPWDVDAGTDVPTFVGGGVLLPGSGTTV